MYRYVVIDDESLSRRGVIKKLDGLSGVVQCCGEAENGMEGISRIEETKPDFVILDMQMPVMNGMKLLPHLAEHYPQLPLIVISGYTNFEYMKQAISSKVINYILKPFSRDEIQDTVRSIVDTLEKKESLQRELSFAWQEQQLAWYQLDLRLIENLIWGHDADGLTIRSETLSFLNESHRFMLFMLYFSAAPAGKFGESIVESDPALGPWVYFPSSTRSRFGFILWTPHDSVTPNRAAASHLAQHFLLTEDPGFAPFSISVSEVHSDIAQLHDALRETRTAMDSLRVDRPRTATLMFRETASPVCIRWEQEAEFLFRVESSDESRALQLLDGLFLQYKNTAGCTLADVKRHCESVCNQCRRMLEARYNEPLLPNMRTMLGTLFTLEDVHQYYRQFFSEACRCTAKSDTSRKDTLIERVEAYIQNNYANPITQELLASLFFVNRSHLSKLFKEQTGKKFADYLNDLRIENSKDLLIRTDMQVFKIARTVGYDNDKYFFKLFKARTGMSPEDFRANNRKPS